MRNRSSLERIDVAGDKLARLGRGSIVENDYCIPMANSLAENKRD